ncbi:MAG: DNA recombination protein RmuC, partial [Burkholderiaceae bacterium]
MTPDIYSISLFYGIVFLILAIGSAFVGFKLYSKLQLKDRELTDLNFELERVKEKLEQMSAMEANIGLLESKLRESQNENQSLDKELIMYKTKVNSLKEKSDFFQEATERLEANFKNLASELFDEKSRLFKETNNSQIESLLKPFKERLVEFESSIELMHKKASDEKLILSKEIDGLKELNYTMNEEAKKLTKALSHEAKVKGNWGELILEKILEGSGLRPGKDFKREVV